MAPIIAAVFSLGLWTWFNVVRHNFLSKISIVKNCLKPTTQPLMLLSRIAENMDNFRENSIPAG
jgi:hypothetical protein